MCSFPARVVRAYTFFRRISDSVSAAASAAPAPIRTGRRPLIVLDLAGRGGIHAVRAVNVWRQYQFSERIAEKELILAVEGDWLR